MKFITIQVDDEIKQVEVPDFFRATYKDTFEDGYRTPLHNKRYLTVKKAMTFAYKQARTDIAKELNS